MSKVYYYPTLQIGKLQHKDYNLPLVIQLASVRGGCEPRRCKSRTYDDTFLAEMQTQADQTLKPKALPSWPFFLLGKEPAGALWLLSKDWKAKTSPPSSLYLSAEFGFVYSWRLSETNISSHLDSLEGGSTLEVREDMSFAWVLSSNFSSSQPSALSPSLHNACYLLDIYFVYQTLIFTYIYARKCKTTIANGKAVSFAIGGSQP